jgi:hypothetical protein
LHLYFKTLHCCTGRDKKSSKFRLAFENWRSIAYKACIWVCEQWLARGRHINLEPVWTGAPMLRFKAERAKAPPMWMSVLGQPR